MKVHTPEDVGYHLVIQLLSEISKLFYYAEPIVANKSRSYNH